MRKKLMFTYIAVIIIVSLIIGFTSINTSQTYLENQMKSSFNRELNLLSDILKNEYIEQNNPVFFEFAQYYSDKMGVRITVIDFDGTVLADSDKDNLSNHSGRIEFKEALADETGFSIRYSESIGTYYLYCAKKIEYNSKSLVLRISMPMLELQSLKTDILNSSMYGIILGMAVSIIIASIFSKLFSNPIKKLTIAVEDVSKGNYDKKIYVDSSDEVGKLTEAFNLMSRELKYTIAELKDRNIKLESILNSMTNGVIAIDTDYNIMLLNHLSCELFDIYDIDITGKPLYEIIRNSHVFDVLEKSTYNKKYVVDEFNYNGESQKVLRIYANPIVSENTDNISIGTVLVVEDVTQIRKLECMRSDFVSNVTHELKTPLTSIKGFVDTLKDGAMNNPVVANKFLDIISIESERLYSLIQEILTLSEIESRDKDVNISRVPVKSIVETVKKILNPIADKKGIELNFNIEKGMIDLFCNPQRITQLLINLVDNAIKYTEKGNVQVEFVNESNILIVTVKDTGLGIPEESISRLFERFYRIDKGRSRKIGGTGLGLSIVKHIVILYKGKIEVKSKLGEYSIFKVALPIFYTQ